MNRFKKFFKYMGKVFKWHEVLRFIYGLLILSMIINENIDVFLIVIMGLWVTFTYLDFIIKKLKILNKNDVVLYSYVKKLGDADEDA